MCASIKTTWERAGASYDNTAAIVVVESEDCRDARDTIDGGVVDCGAGLEVASSAVEEVTRRREEVDASTARGVEGEDSASTRGGEDGWRWYVGLTVDGWGVKREEAVGRMATLMTLCVEAVKCKHEVGLG